MGRPINADGRQTRRAILDAALDLFAEKGYFGTSLRDIAVAVGVRESGFYNYFDSKEALFTALLAAHQESKAEQLAPFLVDKVIDVRLTLEQLTTAVLDYFCRPQQQQLFRVLMSDGMRLAKEGRLDLIERVTSGAAPLRDLMCRLIEAAGLTPRDPEMLAMGFMGPLLLWRHFHTINPNHPLVVDRNTFIHAHVDQFLQGAKRPSVRRVQPKLAVRAELFVVK